MRFKIDVEVRPFHPNSRNVGECHRKKPGSYQLRIHADLSFVDRVTTFIHEATHAYLWEQFRDGALTEQQEHAFLRDLEAYAKKRLRKELG